MMIHRSILKRSSILTAQTGSSKLPVYRYIPFQIEHWKANSRKTSTTTSSKIATVFTEKVRLITKQFDSVLGITEVRSAQNLVQEAEDKFMTSRREVGEIRTELLRLQNELRDLRNKLDRIPREDERYLQLATEEHKALIAERKAKLDLEMLETNERDQFSALSAAVRASHEEERSRAERTKYWSIIASAFGAVLGILGSTIINLKRMKQIKSTVQENNEVFLRKAMEEIRILLMPEQHQTTTTEATQDQRPNEFFALLNENRKVLGAIDAKVDKFFDKETLVSGIQERNDENISNSENSLNSAGLSRGMEDVIWWSQANVIATVASSVCLMIYLLSK
ncbi:uncharacterized protein LOC114517576 [Dendronephthya gigantea]|uniref:uncharacterized protein LOC114517576 n=1 Tax=Dendronephthya gigantea TaxID=151771 RepID=UPI00106BC9D9|nr:uncharacterized protein LOC114517576 [Dendronephthya gigantea]